MSQVKQKAPEVQAQLQETIKTKAPEIQKKVRTLIHVSYVNFHINSTALLGAEQATRTEEREGKRSVLHSSFSPEECLYPTILHSVLKHPTENTVLHYLV